MAAKAFLCNHTNYSPVIHLEYWIQRMIKLFLVSVMHRTDSCCASYKLLDQDSKQVKDSHGYLYHKIYTIALERSIIKEEIKSF